MNYFSHAYELLKQSDPNPNELAGVAVPDWLGVAARKTRVKCRSQHARPYCEAEDPQLAALAQGICQHHTDDGWFHETAIFGQLSLDFAKRVRTQMAEASSLRPWFLGHILVELLLDDVLIQRDPAQLDRYYQLMDQVDATWVARSVETMCGRPVERLAEFIDKYRELRFLADYADDTRLRMRLNQVMHRAGLPELSEHFLGLLPEARQAVADAADELLAQPTTS